MQTENSIKSMPGGGVVISGSEAIKVVGVITLRKAIQLYQRSKIIPTRGMTITKMLTSASAVTGVKYSGGKKLDNAIADLTKWIDDSKCRIEIGAAK